MNSPDGHYSNVTLHSNIYIDLGNNVEPLFVMRSGKLVFNPIFTEDVPDPTPTPSPSPTSTPEATPTPTVSVSSTPTPSVSNTPTPTATDTSTPTPTTTPTGTPESTPTPSPSPSPTETPEVIVALSSDSDNVVTIVNVDGKNEYAFNDNHSADKFALYDGTFTFTGVGSEHPIRFILTEGEGKYTVEGTGAVIIVGHTYYYGTVTLTITGDFGIGSYVCGRHGYMGGQDRLKYDNSFKPSSGLLGVELGDLYNNSLFTGTKTLILQSVVHNDISTKGTMYALTETPIPGATYTLDVLGKPSLLRRIRGREKHVPQRHRRRKDGGMGVLLHDHDIPRRPTDRHIVRV